MGYWRGWKLEEEDMEQFVIKISKNTTNRRVVLLIQLIHASGSQLDFISGLKCKKVLYTIMHCL